ncbi:peroxide stress protein YaaA [uncultured Mesonia sp.]|uniref:peroxide stress protein YaaA n=1 Tax=uncultured Mesonia sp. TaxID=399731 RepID=UPI00374F7008
MKIVISPAKSLNESQDWPIQKSSQPVFLEEAAQINRKLARFSKKELADLMNISDQLADLNYTRNQDFEAKPTAKNAKPAIYMFDGDVYSGLEAETIEEKQADFLQNSLRILSGLYGILKPFDLMQPYRLEMGTKLSIERNKDLYAFWKTKITKQLNEELQENELFVNLASNEYFKAVDKTKLKSQIVTPIFKDFKGDKLKTIAFYAKKARGAMARYLIDHQVSKFEDLLGFTGMDYKYSEEHTDKSNEPVFIR